MMFYSNIIAVYLRTLLLRGEQRITVNGLGGLTAMVTEQTVEHRAPVTFAMALIFYV